MHENERGAAAAVGTNKHWREQSRSSSVGWRAGWLLVAGLFREKSTTGWWLISEAKKTLFWLEASTSTSTSSCPPLLLH
jgi:hypothetical protein